MTAFPADCEESGLPDNKCFLKSRIKQMLENELNFSLKKKMKINKVIFHYTSNCKCLYIYLHERAFIQDFEYKTFGINTGFRFVNRSILYWPGKRFN